MTKMLPSGRSYFVEQRGGVSLLFASCIIPMMMCIGLGIDYSFYAAAQAQLNAAADAAAMHAVRATVMAASAGTNTTTAGVASAQQWFAAEVTPVYGFSVTSGYEPIPASDIAVTYTAATNAYTVTITYTGKVNTHFGGLFNNLRTWNIGGTAAATMSLPPFLQVVLMLDNSASMDIGATNADIAKLSSLSPCDASNAFYLTGTTTAAKTNYNLYSNYVGGITGSDQQYNIYSCGSGSQSYDGQTVCQAALPTMSLAGYTINNSSNQYTNNPAGLPSFPTTGTSPPYVKSGSNYTYPWTCQGSPLQQTNGAYPLPGAPCAFACHWTKTLDNTGNFADLYGMARRFGVTLRFDLVKQAAQETLATMATDNNAGLNTLSVGVYTFNTAVNQIYPTACVPKTFGCEAGNNFSNAETLVGTGDTGIPAHIGLRTGNNYDTDFPDDMNSLYTSYVSPAGNGASSATPKKVMIIVTDGFQDDPVDSSRKAFDYNYCTQFKNAGYTIYVAYTPYYPVMHSSYLGAWIPLVEGTGTDSILYNLGQCSSDPQNDFVSAADGASLNTALVTFLKKAERSAALITN